MLVFKQEFFKYIALIEKILKYSIYAFIFFNFIFLYVVSMDYMYKSGAQELNKNIKSYNEKVNFCAKNRDFCEFAIDPNRLELKRMYIEIQMDQLKSLEQGVSQLYEAVVPVMFNTEVVIVVFFVLWKYSASHNARRLGANMKFSPGWSIAYYFIPFLNLWRPYQAMKEIWNVSHNSMSCKSKKSGKIVVFWWLSFIGYCVLEAV